MQPSLDKGIERSAFAAGRVSIENGRPMPMHSTLVFAGREVHLNLSPAVLPNGGRDQADFSVPSAGSGQAASAFLRFHRTHNPEKGHARTGLLETKSPPQPTWLAS